MSKLGSRLREARLKLAMTQSDVARALGLSVQAVSQWESGRTVPTADRLLFLGDLLQVDLRSANNMGELQPYRQTAAGRAFAVPLISRVTAGQWSETFAVDPSTASEIKTFEIYWPPSGPTFALEIDGESMLPEFKPGDVIIVDSGIEPIPGDFVVAALDGEREATFKKFRPRGVDERGQPVIELAPLNPDYPTLVMSASNPGRIVGTMKEHRSFRRRG